MSLESYIQNLLYHFDCVIIPNFGGIVAQPITASFNTSQHIFYAPKKQLAYNKNLDKNDGLLVNHVALNMNISYSQAVAWVENEVKNWKTQLEDSNKLTISEVGQFKLQSDGNISFEPASFVNYQIESFGFSSFHASPVSSLVSEPVNKKTLKKEPLFIKATKEKSKVAFNINKKKYIAYALALPVLASLIYLPTQTNVFKGVNISYSSLNPFTKSTLQTYSERIPVTFPPLATIVDISTSTAEKPSESEENIIAPNVEIAQATQPEVISKNDNSIHLIVGAFATKENAQALINELNTKGYKAYIQGKSNSGLFRVSCNKFTSKEAAISAKSNLPQEINGWVLSE